MFDSYEVEVMLTTSMKISVHPAPTPQIKLMVVSLLEVPLT